MKKTKNNDIELAGLQDWLSSMTYTYAYSSSENKRLTCDLKGGMTVSVAGEIKWQGMQAFSAVEAYNAITDKYIKPDIKI